MCRRVVMSCVLSGLDKGYYGFRAAVARRLGITSKALWGFFIVLVIVGFYFLLWHIPPLPGNHEDIGIGRDHVVHAVVGIVILIGAALVLLRIRRGAPAPEAPSA